MMFSIGISCCKDEFLAKLGAFTEFELLARFKLFDKLGGGFILIALLTELELFWKLAGGFKLMVLTGFKLLEIGGLMELELFIGLILLVCKLVGSTILTAFGITVFWFGVPYMTLSDLIGWLLVIEGDLCI